MSDAMSTTQLDPKVTQVAPGVLQVAVGEPFFSYAYLLDSPAGVIAFDAGLRGTGPEILAAAGGPIVRVVLSHAHADHRGGAAELDAPIFCHPDEVADAEADWPQDYLDFSLIENERVREALPALNEAWDSGPLRISGTVVEGEELAGFTVVHAPGHAPGEIALFRPTDGLLLAGDVIYTQDLETMRPCPARVPHPCANWDTDQARASIRKLAALGPTSAWPGHGANLAGDVVAQLEVAAAFGTAG